MIQMSYELDLLSYLILSHIHSIADSTLNANKFIRLLQQCPIKNGTLRTRREPYDDIVCVDEH